MGPARHWPPLWSGAALPTRSISDVQVRPPRGDTDGPGQHQAQPWEDPPPRLIRRPVCGLAACGQRGRHPATGSSFCFFHGGRPDAGKRPSGAQRARDGTREGLPPAGVRAASPSPASRPGTPNVAEDADATRTARNGAEGGPGAWASPQALRRRFPSVPLCLARFPTASTIFAQA